MIKYKEILKKKLWSMRYSQEEVQKETSENAKEFMYGYTECINDILMYIHDGSDGLPEHDLPESKDELYPREFVEFCVLNDVWGISSGITYLEQAKNFDLFFNSLDELFKYWQSEVKP
jgi:hypothetical protein